MQPRHRATRVRNVLWYVEEDRAPALRGPFPRQRVRIVNTVIETKPIF